MKIYPYMFEPKTLIYVRISPVVTLEYFLA